MPKPRKPSSDTSDVSDKESASTTTTRVLGTTASTTASTIPQPPITHDFDSSDYAKLIENENFRYLNNSQKVGHIVIKTDATGVKTAMQYQIPQEEGAGVPEVRLMTNVEELQRFGMTRYKANSPGGTPYYAARQPIDFVYKDGNKEGDDWQRMQIATFSPGPTKEPFWGTATELPLFRENLSATRKKELEEEIKEIEENRKKAGTTTKCGNELVVEHESVRIRDSIKTRSPDQNTVMKESAQNAYKHFLDQWNEELHPDLKTIIKRAVDAPLHELFKSNHRPEWLHGEGFSLTPVSKNPQRADNLGAAPKWANTEMMVLERIAKWFALNRPEAFIKIKPTFEMLLDSELIKHIFFEVTVEEKQRVMKFLQEINPFQKFHLFRKATDLAQATAITNSILQGVEPMDTRSISKGKNAPAGSGAAASSVATSAVTSSTVAPSASAAAPSAGRSLLGKRAHSEPSAPSSVSSTSIPVVQPPKPKALKHPTHLYEKSVVQVYSTFQEPDFDDPHKGADTMSCSGTGIVIGHGDKKYILTNAHCAENSVLFRVRLANDRKKKYEAKRVAIGYQCDLALYEVIDPAFSALCEPATLGDMVSHEDKVYTVGFPRGGTEISITKGIVSRIEVDTYCESGLDMLQVQVDAAINHGNSGGPVFSEDGKVVGIAFQGYDNGQNLGYMIPMPVVHHFLKEVCSEKGFQGFPILAITTQHLENPRLRKYYGMTDDQSGVRIKKVDNLSDAYKKLKPDDIILEIDGLKISNTRTVNIPNVGECLDVQHVTHMKYLGDTVTLKILRRNAETKVPEVHNIEVVLDTLPLTTEIVPQKEFDKSPTYYINSGISFTPLSRNYLEGKGSDFESVMVLEEGCELPDRPKKTPDEQLVVINEVLDCEENIGYDENENTLVKEVNGRKINNIRDVIEAMESNTSDTHIILNSDKKIMAVKNMPSAEHAALLKRYKILQDRSDDLMPDQLKLAEKRVVATMPTAATEASIPAAAMVSSSTSAMMQAMPNAETKSKIKPKARHEKEEHHRHHHQHSHHKHKQHTKVSAAPAQEPASARPGMEHFFTTVVNGMAKKYKNTVEDDDVFEDLDKTVSSSDDDESESDLSVSSASSSSSSSGSDTEEEVVSSRSSRMVRMPNRNRLFQDRQREEDTHRVGKHHHKHR